GLVKNHLASATSDNDLHGKPLGPGHFMPPDQVRLTWPHRQDVPMRFAHPRFEAVLASKAGE
ncbi:MAG: hypothetical protein ACREB3_06455, partial [Burkholderiales bacterium]